MGMCLGVISGCGLKWWYSQIDYLLRVRIDRYFDITSQQEDFITRQLETHLHWHRYRGIPIHIAFLKETRIRVNDGVDEEDIVWFFKGYSEQMRLIVERLSEDSIEFLLKLEPDQITYFEEQLREDNETYRERLEMSPEERLEARADSTIESLEDWLGSLSDEQEAEIRRLSLALPDRLEPWYRDRIKRQRMFVNTLREQKDRDAIRKALLQMLLPRNIDREDPFVQPVIEMILVIDRLATRPQRAHVIAKLQGWIDSLQAISEKTPKNPDQKE